MKGFESFDIRAWVDGVLLVCEESASGVAKSGRRVSAGLVVAMSTAVASVTAIGAASAGFKVDAYSSAAWPSDGAARVRDAVPVGYWPRLVATMKTWERVPEMETALSSLEPLL